MTSISLQPITRDNFRACVRLKVAEQQQNFVADNITSIAQAYVEPSWTPLAIYADDTLVGFAMYGRDTDTGFDWIIRLMIDAQQQGKGYGRLAMHALLARIQAQPDCHEIYISYEPTNEVAARLYASLGFEPTGVIEDGEAVARLTKAWR